MRIFITGVTGFIGRNLYEHLQGKYNLICPSHKELELLDLEAVEHFLKKSDIDVIIHCATLGAKRTSLNNPNFIESNLRMFFNLIKCKKHYKKLIFLGSGAEYDKSLNISNICENDFDRGVPKDAYGFYKYVCSKYIEVSKENIINLRLFGIFGKYEDYETRFISNAICRTIFNMPIIISRNVFFDYLYIEDFLKVIEYFILNDSQYKCYNAGTGKKIDLLTIAKKIKRISSNDPEIIVKNKGLDPEYSCNAERLISEINIKNYTDIEDALTKLYGWYKANKSKLSLKKLKGKNGITV